MLTPDDNVVSFFRPFAPFAAATDPLTEILSWLKEPWMGDFLFNATPESDLAALTSPAQMQHAVALEINCTEKDRSGQYSMFEIEHRLVWVFIPQFSVGSVAAEIVLQTSKTTTNPTMEPPYNANTYMRLLHSADSGEMLILTDDQGSDEISLHLFRSNSTTARTRIWLKAHRAPFIRAFRAGAEETRLRHPLIATSVINETRNCMLCGAPHNAYCACKFVTRRALHPLDFSHIRANVSPHLGSFTGAVEVSLYAAGAPCAFAHLDITCTCDPLPASSVPEICGRAAHMRMQQITVVPPAFAAGVQTTIPLVGSHPVMLPFLPASAPVQPALGGLLTDAPYIDDWLGESALLLDAMPAGQSAGSSSSSARQGVGNGAGGPVRTIEAVTMAGGGLGVLEQQRKLMRQMKNRESAAKSNQKRKLAREALKQSLASIRDEEKTLREREMELRKENMRLKKALAELA